MSDHRLLPTISARTEMAEYARRAFRFLEEDAYATVEIRDAPARTELSYSFDPITIEVVLDWREGCSFVLVCRTTAGRSPPGCEQRSAGSRRVHLARALDHGGEPEWSRANDLRRIARASGTGSMKSQLAVSAATLRSTVDRLCRMCDELFPRGAAEDLDRIQTEPYDGFLVRGLQPGSDRAPPHL